MLDESSHSLPGSLTALKQIEKEIGVVSQRLSKNEQATDKLHHTIRACLMENCDTTSGKNIPFHTLLGFCIPLSLLLDLVFLFHTVSFFFIPCVSFSYLDLFFHT
jgi:hypothetical protein